MSNKLAWLREHKLGTLVLLVIGLSAIVFIYLWQAAASNTDVLYIALVRSMNKGYVADGEAMRKAIEMYLEQVNQEGGVNGQRVKLLKFDDNGEREAARQRAQEIVQDQALIVLGHFFSSASIEAGKVYRDAGIPAITGTATADALTLENDWYFSVVPNAGLQGTFLAKYVHQVLQYETVSILYDSQDEYSISLARRFAYPFVGVGGKIENQWDLGRADDVKARIEEIVGELLLKKPDVILVATQQNEAIEFIVQSRRKGLTFPIIGGDALGDITFGSSFDKYPEEQTQPGFFSNGIYASTPLIFDVAGKGAQEFRNKYYEKYDEEPSWKAAGAYDAATVAIEALRATGVQGNLENRAAERAEIKDYLASLVDVEQAIEGVGGAIYFDKHGGSPKSVAIGRFQEQQFVSAPIQLEPVSDLNRISDLDAALAENQVLILNGKYMYQTSIVYVGIEFNQISDLDVKDSTYKLDFYLWFRYRGQVDACNIRFINAVGDIDLGEPIAEEILEDEEDEDTIYHYQLYRVVGRFKGDFDFRHYPFDWQSLEVKFRHAKATRDTLIYVIDQVGMRDSTSEAILKHLEQTKALEPLADWGSRSAGICSDIFVTNSTLGDPRLFGADSVTEYSGFNAFIEIKRDALDFILKSMLKLFIVFFLAYLSFYLPLGHGARLSFATSALFTTALFHLALTNSLPQIGYTVVMEYFFYVGYVLSLVLILFQLVDLRLNVLQTNKDEGEKAAIENLRVRANRIGRVVYPVMTLVVGILVVFKYDISFPTLGPASETMRSTPEPGASAQLPTDDGAATDEEIVLTLGSWRPQDVKQMERILKVFEDENPNISVKFEPTEQYDAVLNTQLENGRAPDLFYVRSFSFSKPLFEAGHLESLQDLPGLNEDNFDSDVLDAWTSDSDERYGVPFIATSHGIYYNRDVFKKLDLETPETWEELIYTTTKTIQDAGYVPFANLPNHDQMVYQVFMNLAPNFIGGREGRQAYLSGERCFDDECTVAAFQALKELGPFLQQDQETLCYDGSKLLFLEGKSPMWMGGSWDIPSFEAAKPDFEWSVFAVPAPAGQPEYVTFHPDAAIGLNAASAHKKEAKLFLEWLTTFEVAKLLSNELPGFFPMHRKAPTIENQHASDFLALNQGRETDVRWAWPELQKGLPNGYDLMTEAAMAVALGDMTPQEAADMLQSGLGQWFEPAQKCKVKNQDVQSVLFTPH